MEEFLKNYAPANCKPASPQTIEKYRSRVPAALVELWQDTGLGKYNQGLLEIINPDDYADSLWEWLGRKVDNYVPIAISGFGDLFYYRKLNETAEDVCLLEIHYRRIETCTWSLDGFFNDFLCDEDIMDEVLRKPLFESAIEKFKSLEIGEAFHFVPALMMGGGEELPYVDKGSAVVHQSLLFQMG